MARSHTATAIKTLAGIMGEKKAPAAARVAAATAILDRGWGKPSQVMEHAGAVKVDQIVRTIVDPKPSD